MELYAMDAKLPAVTPFGKPIPDQFVFNRKEKYLHEGDDCIRPGGCSGTLQPIQDVLGYCRKGHEDWLMCDQCNMRYKPLDRLGYVWADAGYQGYCIEYEEE